MSDISMNCDEYYFKNIQFSNDMTSLNGYVDFYHKKKHIYRIFFGKRNYGSSGIIIRIEYPDGTIIARYRDSDDFFGEHVGEEFYLKVTDFIMLKYSELLICLEEMKKELK